MLVAVVGLALFGALLALVRREVHVSQGADQEIVSDDFGFSVLEHRTQKTIGDVTAKGVFHIVRLEVRNHARRVTYRLDHHHPLLRDEDGRVYPVDVAAQRVLDPTWPQHSEIEHGTTFASQLAFDVPADKQHLCLWISWGGPLVNILDYVVCGPHDIALH
jgi:hypothetical protein